MSNDIERSETGVWLDTQSNAIVSSPPVEGVQLVAPGGELTANVKRAIEQATEGAQPVEEATEPAVETATVKSPSAKAAAKQKD